LEHHYILDQPGGKWTLHNQEKTELQLVKDGAKCGRRDPCVHATS